MKKFSICVETGCTGNDFYELFIEADSLQSAIKKGYVLHKKNRRGAARISESACYEVTDEPKAEIQHYVKICKAVHNNAFGCIINP